MATTASTGRPGQYLTTATPPPLLGKPDGGVTKRKERYMNDLEKRALAGWHVVARRDGLRVIVSATDGERSIDVAALVPSVTTVEAAAVLVGDTLDVDGELVDVRSSVIVDRWNVVLVTVDGRHLTYDRHDSVAIVSDCWDLTDPVLSAVTS